jgi:hypothetical protein
LGIVSLDPVLHFSELAAHRGGGFRQWECSVQFGNEQFLSSLLKVASPYQGVYTSAKSMLAHFTILPRWFSRLCSSPAALLQQPALRYTNRFTFVP